MHSAAAAKPALLNAQIKQVLHSQVGLAQASSLTEPASPIARHQLVNSAAIWPQTQDWPCW